MTPSAIAATLERSGVAPRPRSGSFRDDFSVSPTSLGATALVALTVFLDTVAALANLPYLFLIQTMLMPLVIVGLVVTGTSTRSLATARIDMTLFPAVAWMFVAVTWSANSPIGALRSMLFVIVMLASVHIGASVVDGEQLLSLLAKLATALAVVVLLDAIVRPAIAFSPGAGDASFADLGLRSIFYQKNSLGGAMALSLALRRSISSQVLQRAYTILIVVLLLLSRSSTSLIAAAAILISQWLVDQVAAERRGGRSGGAFLTAGFLTLAVGALAVSKNVIFGALGKDSSLSGRSIIWRYSLRAAAERPWVGYGPGGFWEVAIGPASAVRHAAGWQVPSAHQGLIDLTLEYGLIGVALMGLAYLGCTARVLSRILEGDNSPTVVVSAGMLVATCTSSITEGSVIRPGLIIVSLVSALLLNDSRRREAFSRAHRGGVIED